MRLALVPGVLQSWSDFVEARLCVRDKKHAERIIIQIFGDKTKVPLKPVPNIASYGFTQAHT